jgi:hypothetical protein
MSDRAEECPARDFCLWRDWKEIVIAQLDYFYFIQHTPLNSTVLLYSRNIKKIETPFELLERLFI